MRGAPMILAALARLGGGGGGSVPITEYTAALMAGVHEKIGQSGNVFSQGTVTAAGSSSCRVQVAGTGEGVAAGADGRGVLVSYTSPTFGAAGGPQAQDRVVMVELSPGNHLILGRIGT